MPLPFLTADRAFDDDADDVALPFDDRDRWRRPYRPGPWRVGRRPRCCCCSPRSCCSRRVIIALAGAPVRRRRRASVSRWSSIAGALRLLRMGVWVSARGRAPGGLPQHPTVPGTRSRRCVRCSSRCAGWGCRAPCRDRRWSLVRQGGRPTAAAAADRPQRGLPGARRGLRPGRRHRRGVGRRVRAGLTAVDPLPASASRGSGARSCRRAGRSRAASPCGRGGCPGRRGRRRRAGTSSASRRGRPRSRPCARRRPRRPSRGRCGRWACAPARRRAGRPRRPVRRRAGWRLRTNWVFFQRNQTPMSGRISTATPKVTVSRVPAWMSSTPRLPTRTK